VDRDPIALLPAHAVRIGLIREGDKPDQMLIDFWMTGVDAAAWVGDRYPDPGNTEHTVGDHIRAELYE
jgi:hypothetical protein